MQNGKIGVCVIGAGRAGIIHARDFAARIPQARLVALVDCNEDAVKKGCEEFGLEKYYLSYTEGLKDDAIDAVVIATPTVLHKEIAVAAADSGKHILCEKPMAMNPDECEDMIKAAKENTVKLQIGFMRRFDKGFLAAKEIIKRGDIGEVVLVKSLTHGPSIPKRWQYNMAVSNGPLAEVNSHDIDTLRWFTESEFKEVYAIGGNFRCPEAKEEFPDFYDNVSMVASFANGMQGIIEGAASARYGYDARVEVLGTKGIVFIGQLPENTVVTCSMDRGMTRPIVKSWRDLFVEAYLAEGRAFIECILQDKTPAVTGFDGMMAVKIVNAGNQSIREKRPVQLTY